MVKCIAGIYLVLICGTGLVYAILKAPQVVLGIIGTVVFIASIVWATTVLAPPRGCHIEPSSKWPRPGYNPPPVKNIQKPPISPTGQEAG